VAAKNAAAINTTDHMRAPCLSHSLLENREPGPAGYFTIDAVQSPWYVADVADVAFPVAIGGTADIPQRAENGAIDRKRTSIRAFPRAPLSRYDTASLA
jgi:hypothetical protein